MSADQDYLLIAALDFGTTYSGCAFQMTSDYDPKNPTHKILSPQAWNEGPARLTSMKTPTCLLLDNNKEIDSFGYMAEDKYAELCMDGDDKNFYFFRRFKMELHDTKVSKRWVYSVYRKPLLKTRCKLVVQSVIRLQYVG